jgi:hypothetical protein
MHPFLAEEPIQQKERERKNSGKTKQKATNMVK